MWLLPPPLRPLQELFAADGPVKSSLMESIRAFQSEFQGLTSASISQHRNTTTGVRSKRRADLNKQAQQQDQSRQAAREAAQQQDAMAQLSKSNPNLKVSM